MIGIYQQKLNPFKKKSKFGGGTWHLVESITWFSSDNPFIHSSCMHASSKPMNVVFVWWRDMTSQIESKKPLDGVICKIIEIQIYQNLENISFMKLDSKERFD